MAAGRLLWASSCAARAAPPTPHGPCTPPRDASHAPHAPHAPRAPRAPHAPHAPHTPRTRHTRHTRGPASAHARTARGCTYRSHTPTPVGPAACEIRSRASRHMPHARRRQGAVCYEAGVWARTRFHIDDIVDAFAVHGCAGVWGVIAVGLFHHRDGCARLPPAHSRGRQRQAVPAPHRWRSRSLRARAVAGVRTRPHGHTATRLRGCSPPQTTTRHMDTWNGCCAPAPLLGCAPAPLLPPCL
eukprot:4364380-Prymnesium_polylepis.1